MKIRDRAEYASKPRPLTTTPDQLVVDAAQAMSAKNYGSIIVVDPDTRVIGMMTERDILRRVVAERRDPMTTRVGEVMTTELRLARADDDLVGWLRIMSNERFRRLPIVDADDRLVAVMTQGDFVSYTWPELLGQAKNMAKATFGPDLSMAFMVIGLLIYTVAIIVAVAIFAT
ncbi:CBS domain-containing protein [Sphingomonas qomolangmaensis]|uniref:CBS domain-containing protein n=1 Tax=Sphingomonas qomolangmaensis TaxID=2918765 RepID=A0ABY5L4E5_9SPHN|nr:CBS domain-containing protein [Sphingomonas qomolangmaensis]UUL81367.1 CBS domain-containing protein [Sphingomonas qomolangmaensis]